MELAESVQPKEMPHKKLTADERKRINHLIQTDPYFALVASGKKRIEAIPDYLDAIAFMHHYAPEIYQQLTDGSLDQVLRAIAADLPIGEFVFVVEKWVALYERKIAVTRKYLKMARAENARSSAK